MLTDYQKLVMEKVRDNAALLGKASRDGELNPQKWNDIGSKSEVFQYIKRLWHTIRYFG